MKQPATISNELLDRLIGLSLNSPSFQFELKQIYRDIQKLRKTEPWESFMLEGVYYSKIYDTENSIKAHEHSLKFTNTQLLAYANYAYSMARVGAHEEMLRASECVLNNRCFEEGIVRYALNGAIFLGLMEKASEIKDKFLAQCSAESNELRNLLEAERLLSLFFSKMPRALPSYRSTMDAVREVSQQKKQSITFWSLDMDQDSDGELIYINIGVNADGATVGEMNIEIGEAIAEKSLLDEHWDRVIPCFHPMVFEQTASVCL